MTQCKLYSVVPEIPIQCNRLKQLGNNPNKLSKVIGELCRDNCEACPDLYLQEISDSSYVDEVMKRLDGGQNDRQIVR